MNSLSALFICLAGAFPPEALQDGVKPIPPARYWYGNPLKEGTIDEVEKAYSLAALATLDVKERHALDKLKTVGFTTPDNRHFKFVVKDGKRVVTPPRGIHLSFTPVNEQGMKIPLPASKDLPPLADLRHVERFIVGGKFVDDAMLDLLRNMDELSYLAIFYTRITDAGLKKLVGLKALRHLELEDADISDSGLATLARFPALEEITLNRTLRITDAGLKALAKNDKLKSLYVGGALVPGQDFAVGDAGLSALAALPQLTVLGIKFCGVTDKGVAEMAIQGRFAKLAILELACHGVTDDGLKNLQDPKALPGLKFLDLHTTQVTPGGVAALVKARPGLHLRVSYEDGTRFDSAFQR
jgi:hypothetical protein